MTFHQIEIFHHIVETQGFAAAGEKLLLSQPSISAQLKSLEKSLGLILIDREQSSQTNGIVLTEDGRFVFQATKRLLSEWANILEYSKNSKNKVLRIQVITNSTIGSYLLPRMLSSFYSANLSTKVKLSVETDYNKLIKLSKSKSCDLCIAPLTKDVLSNFNVLYSFKIPIFLVTGNGHFCVQDKLSIKVLNSLTLILPPLNSVVRKVLDTFFSENSLQIRSFMELDHSESVKRVLQSSNSYFALLSSISVSEETKTGPIHIIQTDPPLPCVEYMVFNQLAKPLQKHVRQFVDYLKNYLSD